MSSDEFSYLYLIQLNNSNSFKIGLTKRNMSNRLKELSVVPNHKLHCKLISDWYKNAKLLERILHRSLDYCKIESNLREWFELEEPELDFVKTAFIRGKLKYYYMSPDNKPDYYDNIEDIFFERYKSSGTFTITIQDLCKKLDITFKDNAAHIAYLLMCKGMTEYPLNTFTYKYN